jgi:hypothetical protein
MGVIPSWGSGVVAAQPSRSDYTETDDHEEQQNLLHGG